jgi:hypothetical protein
MPPIAKQRRNRERATELITVLDGMVGRLILRLGFRVDGLGSPLELGVLCCSWGGRRSRGREPSGTALGP